MRSIAEDPRTPRRLMLLFGLLMIPVLIHEQRETGPWFDTWPFLLDRGTFSLKTVMGDYNGHLMIPTNLGFLLDKALFWPGAPGLLTAFSIGAQLAIAGLIFEYVRRRGNQWFALCAGILVLVYGLGYEVTLWSFNFGWLTAIAAGLGALVTFEGGDSTRRRVAASALLVLCISSGGVGLPFAAGLAVYVLFSETRRKALTVLAFPFLYFAVWLLIDSPSSAAVHNPRAMPGFVMEAVAGAFGGIFGTGLEWGRPLAVGGVIGLVYALSKESKFRPQSCVAFAIPATFVVLTAYERAGDLAPNSSRYVYSLFVMLIPLAAEATRGLKIKSPMTIGFLWIVFGLAVIANGSAMLDGSTKLRFGYGYNRTHLTALVEAGPAAARATRVDPGDWALTSSNNYRIYRWVMDNGPSHYTYSQQELAANPALRAEVERIVAGMRAEAKAAAGGQ